MTHVPFDRLNPPPPPSQARRQYVACQFKPGEGRSYTYHNDGEPVAIGDKVVVTTNRGPATVTVVGLSDEQPSFATKPIVGKARPLDFGDAVAGPDLATQVPPTFGGDS